jgi:hypothetical protein
LFLGHSKSYGHESHCNCFLQIHTVLTEYFLLQL